MDSLTYEDHVARVSRWVEGGSANMVARSIVDDRNRIDELRTMIDNLRGKIADPLTVSREADLRAELDRLSERNAKLRRDRARARLDRRDSAAQEVALRTALDSVWRHHGKAPPDGCGTCDALIDEALATPSPAAVALAEWVARAEEVLAERDAALKREAALRAAIEEYCDLSAMDNEREPTILTDALNA